MLLGLLPGFLSSADDLMAAHLLGLDPSELGWLSGFLSSADDLAEAHLLGLKHPEVTASGSRCLVGRLTGDCAEEIGALIIFDR